MTSVANAPVGYEQIGPRICVTAPYYALSNLMSPTPGLAHATVPVESPMGRQATLINAAEAGRHLAILGLCAAATINPNTDRHYYLAHRGIGRIYPPGETLGRLHGTARARMTSRNRAAAETELRDADGNLVARLAVEYLVMSIPVFRRLMGPAGAPDANEPANPYRSAASLADISADAHTATAKLAVDSTMCRGHFDGYPALPVSMAGYAAFALFDHLLEATAGPDAQWRGGAYLLRADHLAAAGQSCTVDVGPSAPAEPDGRNQAFTGTLRSGDREILSVQMDYTTV
jgi:hypothetical protein